MGMKHRVDKGIYVAYGAINTQLASKTRFSDADADKIKEALKTLFVNDVSSARPEGSMEVLKVIWWKHNSKSGQYSSAKVHRSLSVKLKKELEDEKKEPKSIDILIQPLSGLTPEVIEGL
jgi:CRISPR-associated protein Csd2